MKKIFWIYLIIVPVFLLLFTTFCKKEEPATVPDLNTTAITNITTTTATGGGNIISDGHSAITAKGICWGIAANPTTSNSKINDGSGIGQFVSNITGLTAGTTYHFRAYATNSVGTGYGNEVVITTSPIIIATLTTTAVNSITSTNAVSGGNITADGGGVITARGVCWGTSINPIISDNKTTDGIGTGSFISNITGLSPNTSYWLRAYATNSAGTAYANQSFNFKTAGSFASLTTSLISNKTSISATCGGYISTDGGSTVTTRGVCWGTNPNPTISNTKTVDGSGIGSFASNITGLTAGTTYYVRAYSTNSSGTAYGNQVSFMTNPISVGTVTTSAVSSITTSSAMSGGNISADGGATITARGVCWGTNPNPTISNTKTVDGSGIGSFASNITGLTAGKTYYVRAYATNSSGTAYGNELSFTTLTNLLTLSTVVVRGITQTSAFCVGIITSQGKSPITSRGISCTKFPNPSIGFNKIESSLTGSDFGVPITGLDPFRTYYVRAYATNSEGTTYGNEISFTTLGILFNPNKTYGTVTDIDGNVYKTIQIGTQTWMAENLKTTKYNDGSTIRLQKERWETALNAYCWYDNDMSNKADYGALYNWNATGTITQKFALCPAGWHVPTNNELTTLITYVNSSMSRLIEGGSYWSNSSLDNSSGFTAIPSGWRNSEFGFFQYIKLYGRWWSSTTYEKNFTKAYYMQIDNLGVTIDFSSKQDGYCIRCLKNAN